MTTHHHRRILEDPDGNRIVLDEACCPVCTRPLEGLDESEQPSDEGIALCECAKCCDGLVYEVRWRDHSLEFGVDGADTYRVERIVAVVTSCEHCGRRLPNDGSAHQHRRMCEQLALQAELCKARVLGNDERVAELESRLEGVR